MLLFTYDVDSVCRPLPPSTASSADCPTRPIRRGSAASDDFARRRCVSSPESNTLVPPLHLVRLHQLDIGEHELYRMSTFQDGTRRTLPSHGGFPPETEGFTWTKESTHHRRANRRTAAGTPVTRPRLSDSVDPTRPGRIRRLRPSTVRFESGEQHFSTASSSGSTASTGHR